MWLVLLLKFHSQHAIINYHDFSVFLREQPHLEDYFRSIFNVTKRNVTFNGNTITANYNTFVNSTKATESYKTMPFDMIDPEVYKTRTDRSIAKQGRAEKWNGFTRAYWCITCAYCGKEVRFCSMCQGELLPVDRKTESDQKEEDKTLKKMQCTECHRVITLRFCSNCGHQFKEEEIDAHMEIPGVNVGMTLISRLQSEIKEHAGTLYVLSVFNRMKKSFVRIHNQFLYIYASIYAEAPTTVVSMEKATVAPYICLISVIVSVNDESNKRSGYFGFRMQFPATYDREFYTTSESERDEWIAVIRDMTEVRKIEDFFDIREKIGEGRFATVYRVESLAMVDEQCVDKKTLKEYAVKVINKKKLTEVGIYVRNSDMQKEAGLIQTEIAILTLVQHKNIVELIDTFEAKDVIL